MEQQHHPFIDIMSRKRFRIIVRKDIVYDISADTLPEAQEAALEENYTKIIEEDVDYIRITDAWEVALDGSLLLFEEGEDDDKDEKLRP